MDESNPFRGVNAADDPAVEDMKADLALLWHVEFVLKHEIDRFDFLGTIGCPPGEYEHLKRKYSRVLERYRKEHNEPKSE